MAASCMIAITAASLLPLALHRFGGASWSRLSDIGQAYGILAALLTALTLAGMTVSVFLQAREVRTSQEHSTRMLHIELVRMTIDDPSLRLWRTDSDTETRRQQYVNLWIMLWKSLYRLGRMSDDELRLIVRTELFGEHTDKEFGHRFWMRSREAYLKIASERGEYRFFAILEDEYQKSVPAPPRPSRKSGHRGALMGIALGVAVGGALSHRIRHARRIRHTL